MVITQESSPTVWGRLKAQWLKEQQPTFVTAGSMQYQAVQDAETKEIVFRPVADAGLMGSTSTAVLVK